MKSLIPILCLFTLTAFTQTPEEHYKKAGSKAAMQDFRGALNELDKAIEKILVSLGLLILEVTSEMNWMIIMELFKITISQ